MNLGTFSISLSVKDIEQSLEFYQKFGFQAIDVGHINEGFKDTDTMKWRILEHPSVKIGLFLGMFDQSILTFNPSDVMSIQASLIANGISIKKEAKENDPIKSIIFNDPDGNQIMLDQH